MDFLQKLLGIGGKQQAVPLLKNGYPAHYQDNVYHMMSGPTRHDYVKYKKVPYEDEVFVGNPRNPNQFSPQNADVAHMQGAMQPYGGRGDEDQQTASEALHNTGYINPQTSLNGRLLQPQRMRGMGPAQVAQTNMLTNLARPTLNLPSNFQQGGVPGLSFPQQQPIQFYPPQDQEYLRRLGL